MEKHQAVQKIMKLHDISTEIQSPRRRIDLVHPCEAKHATMTHYAIQALHQVTSSICINLKDGTVHSSGALTNLMDS